MLISNQVPEAGSARVLTINDVAYAVATYDGEQYFVANAMNELANEYFSRDERLHLLLRGQSNLADFIAFEVRTGWKVTDFFEYLTRIISDNKHRFPDEFADYISYSMD